MTSLSRLIAAALLVSAACGGPDPAAPPSSGPSRPPPTAEPRATLPGADPVADWPLIFPGVESRQFSSFDRMGGNDDGFTGTHSALYGDAAGEHVIFDALGPGRLNTLWFTGGVNGREPLEVGAIRFYFDDEAAPRAEVDPARLFAGTAPGFPPDLVFDNTRSTGGFVSFVPMVFARRLRITTAERPYFYNAQYDAFPADSVATSWTPSADVSLLSRRFAGVATGSAAEQDIPLDYAHTGAGTLESLTVYPEPGHAAALRDARIRIVWDDQAAAAVDCPLFAFFGSGLGSADVRSMAFSIREGPVLSSRFPMPFWRSFRLEITGITGRATVRVGPTQYPQGRSGYFRAVCSDAEAGPGDDFVYVEQPGAGKLVGTVLTVRPGNAPVEKGWWEGDLRSYADGRRTPGIHGTGHEDDHLGGWSNEFLLGPFTLPMNGAPRVDLLDLNRPYNGDATMYRLFTGIPFLRGIVHSVEHGIDNASRAAYSAATFLYASGAPWLADSDRLDVCDDASRTAHAYVADQEAAGETMESAFEGRASRNPTSGCQRSHSGAAEFRLAVDAANAGVYLRRSFDQSRPRQRATVSVDGQTVGDWYVAEGNAVQRWAERDYFLPARFTAGKRSLSVRIAPVPQSPPWSAAEYRALSVTPPAGVP